MYVPRCSNEGVPHFFYTGEVEKNNKKNTETKCDHGADLQMHRNQVRPRCRFADAQKPSATTVPICRCTEVKCDHGADLQMHRSQVRPRRRFADAQKPSATTAPICRCTETKCDH